MRIFIFIITMRTASLLACSPQLTVTVASDGEIIASASYLEDVIPPCSNITAPDIDPCEVRDHFGIPNFSSPASLALPDKAPTLGMLLTNEIDSSLDYTANRMHMFGVIHIAVRGLLKPSTTRCASYPFILPDWIAGDDGEWQITERTFSEHGVGSLRHLLCHTDMTVHEYIIGTGPTELTVTHPVGLPHAVEMDRQMYDDILKQVKKELALAVENREWVLMLTAPYLDVLEGWMVTGYWDVQKYPDDNVSVVSDFKQHYPSTPENLALLEMSLGDFRSGIRSAHSVRVTRTSGRVGVDADTPKLVSDANLISTYFKETGAYDRRRPTPAPPLMPGANDPWAPGTNVGDPPPGGDATAAVPGGPDDTPTNTPTPIPTPTVTPTPASTPTLNTP